MDNEEKNYVHLTPNLFQRLIGNDEMLVLDMNVNDAYLLDRFLIAEKVTVSYPDDIEEFVRDDMPDCRLYRIRYRRKDRNRVIAALDKLRHNVSLLADGEEYRQGMKIFSWLKDVRENPDSLKEAG